MAGTESTDRTPTTAEPDGTKDREGSSVAVYQAMEGLARQAQNHQVADFLGTLAFWASLEELVRETRPHEYAQMSRNRHPRIIPQRDPSTGSAFDISPIITSANRHVLDVAVRVSEAHMQLEPGAEIDITPPGFQEPVADDGRRRRELLGVNEIAVLSRFADIKAMLGAEFGKPEKPTPNVPMTETHYPTGMGFTLVERDIKTDRTIAVMLPSGMREIQGNTKVLSLKRTGPGQKSPAPRGGKRTTAR